MEEYQQLLKKDETSLLSKFKNLDMYKKVPQDHTKASTQGAILSFLTIGVIIALSVLECLSYYKGNPAESNMHVLSSQIQDKKVSANINIILHRLPCSVASLDYVDAVGAHEMNIGGALKKIQLDSKGDLIEAIQEQQQQNYDVEQIKQAFSRQEGCQIIGTFAIQRVPGHFQISVNSLGGIFNLLVHQKIIEKIDLSHTLVSLYFGDFLKIQQAIFSFSKYSQHIYSLHNINSTKQAKDTVNFNDHITYNYQLNIVQTQYKTYFSTIDDVYQYAALYYYTNVNYFPSIIFRYEFDSISMKVSRGKVKIFHLIVQFCAIIGGVIVVAKIFDMFLSLIFKKSNSEVFNLQ